MISLSLWGSEAGLSKGWQAPESLGATFSHIEVDFAWRSL
jgi:hypothetical protein